MRVYLFFYQSKKRPLIKMSHILLDIFCIFVFSNNLIWFKIVRFLYFNNSMSKKRKRFVYLVLWRIRTGLYILYCHVLEQVWKYFCCCCFCFVNKQHLHFVLLNNTEHCIVWQRNWVFATFCDFLIPISLQPNVVDLDT